MHTKDNAITNRMRQSYRFRRFHLSILSRLTVSVHTMEKLNELIVTIYFNTMDSDDSIILLKEADQVN